MFLFAAHELRLQNVHGRPAQTRLLEYIIDSIKHLLRQKHSQSRFLRASIAGRESANEAVVTRNIWRPSQTIPLHDIGSQRCE